VFLAASLGVAVQPARATLPSDLCTGNPCVISGARTIDAGSVLDFGAATALRLGPSAVLTIGPGTKRTIEIRAGSIVGQPGGAILGGGDLAEITVSAVAGGLELQRNGTVAARIEANGNQAGSVVLSASGSMLLAGNVEARGSGRDAQGGSIDLDADGDLIATASLLASAVGSGSAGGTISVHAGSAITIDGALGVSGADFGGGEIALAADAGSINLSGGSPDGSAGSLDLSAEAGDVSLTADLTGIGGTGAQGACGDGALVTLVARRDAVLGGQIDISSGTHCTGGELTVEAGGDVRQLNGSTFKSRGPGIFGSGGRLAVSAGGAVTLRNADVTSAGVGGSLEVVAVEEVTVRGLVDASASGSDGTGGTTLLQACHVVVSPSATLDTRGASVLAPFGVNLLRASGSMAVAGKLLAAAGNRLAHKGPAPNVTGTVTPSATIMLDPTLPDCPALPECGNAVTDPGEICDDGNTSTCDGCSADCMRVDGLCGDGARECVEQCDDGNLLEGDGCESDCTLTPPESVRVRGFPLESAGCLAQWALRLPAPTLEPSTGLPANEQRCSDGDPACDADDIGDGVCSFDLQVCLRVPDPAIPACAPNGVKLLSIDRPKPAGGDDPVDRDNLATLAAALRALGVKVKSGTLLLQQGAPVTAADTCTTTARLRVPHRPGAAGVRTFRISARATGSSPNMQRNGLHLSCDPAPAICGDGIVQSGEGCDDGNVTSCDGCSADCRSESCGNAIVECGEECDLGADNGGPDASCTSSCERLTPELRIPGNGARRFECAHEWSAQIAAADVPHDRAGLPKTSLTCTDGDPSCDRDPRRGICRMRIWSCFAGADPRLGCAAQPVSGATILAPKSTRRITAAIPARAALAAAHAALKFPVANGEQCTPPEICELPVTTAWLELKIETQLSTARARDRDVLRLRCVAP